MNVRLHEALASLPTMSEREFKSIQRRIQQAILKSQHCNSVVKMPWSREVEAELAVLSKDCVPDCGGFWGEGWRILLTRKV